MKRFVHMTPNSVLVGPEDPEMWEVAVVCSEGCEDALTLEEKQEIAHMVRRRLDKKKRSVISVMPIIPIMQGEGKK